MDWLFLTDIKERVFFALILALRRFCGSMGPNLRLPEAETCFLYRSDPVRMGVLPCLVVRGRLEGRKSMHAGELMNPASASRAEQSSQPDFLNAGCVRRMKGREGLLHAGVRE